jgi:hypothetical protein
MFARKLNGAATGVDIGAAGAASRDAVISVEPPPRLWHLGFSRGGAEALCLLY